LTLNLLAPQSSQVLQQIHVHLDKKNSLNWKKKIHEESKPVSNESWAVLSFGDTSPPKTDNAFDLAL
jgi:hypothetical protein